MFVKIQRPNYLQNVCSISELVVTSSVAPARRFDTHVGVVFSGLGPWMKNHKGIPISLQRHPQQCPVHCEVLVTRKEDRTLGHRVYRKIRHTDRYLYAEHTTQKWGVINTLMQPAKMISESKHLRRSAAAPSPSTAEEWVHKATHRKGNPQRTQEGRIRGFHHHSPRSTVPSPGSNGNRRIYNYQASVTYPVVESLHRPDRRHISRRTNEHVHYTRNR